MPTALGLDLAKRTTWYAAVADGDRLIEDGKIPSKARDVVRIVDKFDPEVVLVEASSVTAWAVDALVDADAPVWPVHPGSLPSRKSRRRKTDRIDARLLVRLWPAGWSRSPAGSGATKPTSSHPGVLRATLAGHRPRRWTAWPRMSKRRPGRNTGWTLPLAGPAPGGHREC